MVHVAGVYCWSVGTLEVVWRVPFLAAARLTIRYFQAPEDWTLPAEWRCSALQSKSRLAGQRGLIAQIEGYNTPIQQVVVRRPRHIATACLPAVAMTELRLYSIQDQASN